MKERTIHEAAKQEDVMNEMPRNVHADFAWPSVGHPGLAPTNSLIGDPRQPRKHFGWAEISALATTMRPGKHTRQREIITVRVATESEMQANPGVRYVVKSGERRWSAAREAGVEMLEVRVKEYESWAEEMLDMYMLNEGRVSLSDIENARYLQGLMEEFKLETQGELAHLVGKDQVYISNHLALLKLIPEVQALMEPIIPERSRLRMSTALMLARLNSDVQRDVVTRMPRGPGVTARRQVDWIKNEILSGNLSVPTREKSAKTMRRILLLFFDRTRGRTNELLTFPNFAGLFDHVSPAHRVDFLKKVEEVKGCFDLLAKQIMSSGENDTPDPESEERSQPFDVIDEAEGHDTVGDLTDASGSVERPDGSDAEKQAASKPGATTSNAPAPLPAPPKRPTSPSRPPVAASGRSPLIGNSSWGRAERPRPSTFPQPMESRGERTVSYLDNNVGRIVMGSVNCQRYGELWDAGLLKFQQRGEPKPEHLPDRSVKW